MISILKTKIKYLVCLALVLIPLTGLAQSSLSLSVSPTLYEMTANPSQSWDSTIRIINSNPYEITVYADVSNFAPRGETGQARFLPIDEEESQGQSLAEWVELESDEIKIPAEQTVELAFNITVPDDAPPGGHYAAILIGTRPDLGDADTSQLETSQVVTSLIFLGVTGDVVEDGVIRSFRAEDYVAERPEVDFELRFENRGNVHILPQGEIKIFNMWGEERGVIPVNQHMMFGNVLPEQIRKYNFSWTGEWSLADMGRYTAKATLGYGSDSKQFTTSETAFWVIPWKIAGTVLLFIFGFIYLITWSIKLYIRRVLTMSGLNADQVSSGRQFEVRRPPKVSLVAPIGEGILDLRQSFNASVSFTAKLKTLFTYIRKYKIFLLTILSVLLFVTLLVWYVTNASVDERGYEVTIENEGDDVKISSEQLEYNELKNADSQASAEVKKEDFPVVKVINRSGVSGLAAQMRIQLEKAGYKVADLSTDFTTTEKNTVIVYHPDYSEEALQLSSEIDNSLLSAYEKASSEQPITIYVGHDYENAI